MIRRLLRWTIRLFLIALVLGVLLAWLLPEQVLPPVAEFLDVSEPPCHVDYVLVLNGDPRTRPLAAAALVRTGLAREVLLSPQRLTIESATVQDGALPSELELTRRVLRARGISDAAIHVLPGEISSTFDEAALLARFLDTHTDATVAVVTNGFHTRRARWVFRRQLGNRAGQVHFVGVPRDDAEARTWWRTREGWNVYPGEYAKLVYYRARY